MAECKPVEFISIGQWTEEKDDKGVHYLAQCQNKNSKGKATPVVAVVYGKYQCEHLKTNTVYQGKFFKKGEEWHVSITAKDNPDIANPKQSSFGGGGGGFERDTKMIAVQCAFKGAIDLVASGVDKLNVSDVPVLTKQFFDMFYIIAHPSETQPAQASNPVVHEEEREKEQDDDNLPF